MNNEIIILSFDVGIINLAYCLLQINIVSKTWTILKWDILSISNKQTNSVIKQSCNYKKKDLSKCSNNATYKVIKNDECNIYCKTQAKKFPEKIKII